MSELIDPNQFIIKHKRKLYRFALFSNSNLCFEAKDWGKTWQPDVIEIGAGSGLFSLKLAKLDKSKHFLAVDVKGDRLQLGAYKAKELGLTNIYFLRARADQLPSLLKLRSIKEIWLTFSDPFPKKRAAGRRLTNPFFLKIYRQLLIEDGAIKFKTDDANFFNWSLEQFVGNDFIIKELSFDLHQSDLTGECQITTTYEDRFMVENKKINYVKVI